MTEIVRELQMDPSEEHEEEEEETQDGWEETEAEWSDDASGYGDSHLHDGFIGIPGTIDPHSLEDMVADSSLAIYFRDITRVPLLTAEQEVQLATAYEKGEIARRLVIEWADQHARFANPSELLAGELSVRRPLLDAF